MLFALGTCSRDVGYYVYNWFNQYDQPPVNPGHLLFKGIFWFKVNILEQLFVLTSLTLWCCYIGMRWIWVLLIVEFSVFPCFVCWGHWPVLKVSHESGWRSTKWHDTLSLFKPSHICSILVSKWNLSFLILHFLSVCVCVCACVRACVRAWSRPCPSPGAGLDPVPEQD